MRKIIFVLLLMFAFICMQSQNYQIDFSGSGQSTTVDSVLVENLSQGTSLTLNGSDVLHLVESLGINTLDYFNKHLKIYPNPMGETTNIEFYQENPGQVDITIFDATGRLIANHSRHIEQGTNTFSVTGLGQGIFTVNVSTSDGQFTGKLISAGRDFGNVTINHPNSDHELFQTGTFKNTSNLIPMQYNDGEVLKLTAYSGNYATTTTLVPDESQTVNFEFMNCEDGSGNSYSVVTIGDQVWMGENLNTTSHSDGTPIPIVNDNNEWSGQTAHACCWYDNNDAKRDIYGVLYNWYAVDYGLLCPSGWHVPTDVDWDILEAYLGGTDIAGGKLKETGTNHWGIPNTGATNSSGFTGLPGGDRQHYNGWFVNIESYGSWWEDKEYEGDLDHAWIRGLYYYDNDVERYYYFKWSGRSVRCVKN